jgi:hypothetical protein
MKEMKYIVVTNKDNEEEMFIFPKSVNHDCFAEVVDRIKNQSYGQWSRERRVVVSAGFTNGLSCYGKSESLGVASRDIDTKIMVNG